MKPWQHILLGILLGLLFAGLILLFVLPQRGTPIPLVTITANPAVRQTPEIGQIKVEITGAVKRPGVYDFPKGTHLVEAVELAGGAAEGADFSKMNLALVLKDGQKINIPNLTSQNEISDQVGSGVLLDINTATADQLMSLPQIGELKAQAIVNYRNDHGRFKALDDLMEVPGIGESIFEGLKSLITIDT